MHAHRTACIALLALAPLASAQTATGVVFHDANANGVRDAGETPVARVLISNGRDVVRTDADGRYEIAVDDDTILFVCKPRGWMVPVNANGLPQHYYTHKPNGSPALKYGGVAPTGPLPASIDFPLVPRVESGPFEVILFGDPQPYTIEQVDHFKNDIVPEVIEYVRTNEGVAFGVTLGDIVGDDLALFAPLNDVIGTLDTPWINVMGNHDLDFDARDEEHSGETFNRVYGPATHAYQHGGVHFIVIDNVLYSGGTAEDPKGSYTAGLTDDDRAFVTDYLVHIADALKEDAAREPSTMPRVVFLMHIPAVELDGFPASIVEPSPLGELDRARLDYALAFATLSVGAHWHRHQNYMIESDHDHAHAHGPAVHHHVVNVTTSGSWWQGAQDEYGIPHTLMRDGRPNGWSVLRFDPTLERGYELRYKAARKPWNAQLHIHAPDRVSTVGDERTVTVNLWSGSELSNVEVRYTHAQSGDTTAWRTMRATKGIDPYWQRLKLLELAGLAPKMTGSAPETMLFVNEMPETLKAGAYTIEVRETNMYGHVHHGYRVIRVAK